MPMRRPNTDVHEHDYITDPADLRHAWTAQACKKLFGSPISPAQREDEYRAALAASWDDSSIADVDNLLAIFNPLVLHQVVSRARRNRATKDDLLPIELLLAGWPAVHPFLLRFFHLVIACFCIPPEIRDPRLLPVLKPGKPVDQLDSFRFLGIMSHVSNLLGGVLNYLALKEIPFGPSHFGNRPHCECLMAVWILLQFEERALNSSFGVISIFYDIENFFPSMQFDRLLEDMKCKNASNALQTLTRLIHKDTIFESKVGRDLDFIRPDRGSIVGHRASPIESSIMMSCCIEELAAARRQANLPCQHISFCDLGSDIPESLPAEEVHFVDDLTEFRLFDPQSMSPSDVIQLVSLMASLARTTFFSHGELKLAFGAQGKSQFDVTFPAGFSSQASQFRKAACDGIPLAATRIFPLSIMRHLGTARVANRRLFFKTMVDARITKTQNKYYSLTKAVWTVRVLSFPARRVFVRETLQVLEWSLHIIDLDESHYRSLERMEYRILLWACKSSRSRLWVREVYRPGGRRRISYAALLRFWNFSPLRRRLQNTRLGFLRRLLLAPATLARATLLGTFNSVEQAAGRVWTAWDRLIDIDLDHFNRAFGSAHDRRSWFSLMKRSSAQEWKTFRDDLEHSPEPVDFTAHKARGSQGSGAPLSCTLCNAQVYSYRALFRHRLTAHPEWNNPALSYFSSHHKECPFCLCFVSRYRHFLNDTTSACFHAYRSWEASGATAASLTNFLGSVPPCSPARAADAIWQAIRLHEPTKNRALLQQRMAALAPRVAQWSKVACLRKRPVDTALSMPHSVYCAGWRTVDSKGGSRLQKRRPRSFSGVPQYYFSFGYRNSSGTLLSTTPLCIVASSCSRDIAAVTHARNERFCEMVARDVAAYNGVSSFRPLLNIISLPRPQLPADDLEFSRFLCRPDF